MTLQQLKYFITAAELKNITHAAEQLYTSQPTISRQIKMLEDELGYVLFDRSGKKLELTESGRILYDGMKQVMNQIDLTLETADIAAQGKSGTISIAFQIGYYCEYIFLPILDDLKRAWPSLDIRCTKMSTDEQLDALKTGSVDIVIGIDFPHWKNAGYISKKIQKEETLIVMYKDHPLAKKNQLEYDDLVGQTFFLTEPNGYQVKTIFDGLFNLNNVKQIGVKESEVAYLRTMSDGGLTISNPNDPYLINNPFFHTIPFKSDYTDTYVCVYNPKNKNPIIDLFLEKINEL